MVRRSPVAPVDRSGEQAPIPDSSSGQCFCDGCGGVIHEAPVICGVCPGVFNSDCHFGHRDTVSGLLCSGGLPAADPSEPSPAPRGSGADRSLSPPAEGRWTDRGVLPKAPKIVPRYALDELLSSAGCGEAKKVYVVHPAPWPGVYLTWTSVSEQTVGAPGTHQCSEKRGLLPALETLPNTLEKEARVYY